MKMLRPLIRLSFCLQSTGPFDTFRKRLNTHARSKVCLVWALHEPYTKIVDPGSRYVGARGNKLSIDQRTKLVAPGLDEHHCILSLPSCIQDLRLFLAAEVEQSLRTPLNA